jgi:hypothetical protein
MDETVGRSEGSTVSVDSFKRSSGLPSDRAERLALLEAHSRVTDANMMQGQHWDSEEEEESEPPVSHYNMLDETLSKENMNSNEKLSPISALDILNQFREERLDLNAWMDQLH